MSTPDAKLPPIHAPSQCRLALTLVRDQLEAEGLEVSLDVMAERIVIGDGTMTLMPPGVGFHKHWRMFHSRQWIWPVATVLGVVAMVKAAEGAA